jgi:hypothetical protein
MIEITVKIILMPNKCGKRENNTGRDIIIVDKATTNQRISSNEKWELPWRIPFINRPPTLIIDIAAIILEIIDVLVLSILFPPYFLTGTLRDYNETFKSLISLVQVPVINFL